MTYYEKLQIFPILAITSGAVSREDYQTRHELRHYHEDWHKLQCTIAADYSRCWQEKGDLRIS
ncbi:hypothetical protein DXZ79_07100 [Yersinia rochesterensis]|uniref:Uncharacterized protein n=1 Tax=Yersinia rochesterensis TaxID=1604335 RepID=A0A8D4N260_9GAMM|nr:hypothetical protein DXZ79_07100 [Yersinia rochesterensis]